MERTRTPTTAPDARRAFGLAVSAVLLTLVGYVTTVELISMVFGRLPLPMQPVTMLEPFRIANQYGLFAVMTRGRYEIEFQGSRDGQAWVAYPFRFKPQALNRAPGIYAPYQPRFEWNLWFASLGSWQQNPLVPRTEERLLTNDPDVLALFAAQSLRRLPLPARYAPCCGNTGLLRWSKSAPLATGGRASCWGSTPRCWSAMPRVGSPSSLCPIRCPPTTRPAKDQAS